MMNINLTDIPAWWGAILSTVLAIVGVIHYFLMRPKLDVELTLKKSDDIRFPMRVERILLKIVSTHTTSILRCDIHAFKPFHWKRRLFGIGPVSPLKFAVSAAHFGDFPLPKRLEAADVMHGWLDAKLLYKDFNAAHGRFQFEIFHTLRKRPSTVILRLPKDFMKTQEPMPGVVHIIVVKGMDESQRKALDDAFTDELGIKQFRMSYSTSSDLVEYEFILPEQLESDRIADIVKRQGGHLANFSVR